MLRRLQTTSEPVPNRNRIDRRTQEPTEINPSTPWRGSAGGWENWEVSGRLAPPRFSTLPKLLDNWRRKRNTTGRSRHRAAMEPGGTFSYLKRAICSGRPQAHRSREGYCGAQVRAGSDQVGDLGFRAGRRACLRLRRHQCHAGHAGEAGSSRGTDQGRIAFVAPQGSRRRRSASDCQEPASARSGRSPTPSLGPAFLTAVGRIANPPLYGTGCQLVLQEHPVARSPGR
jgi:hypothetical protein